MRREHHAWESPALWGRRMELLVFGHAGARVLVYPTSMGSYFEWEDRGMVGALAEHLERGWIQLFCVGSVDAESWYARWRHPHDRAEWQDRYDRYVHEEVLPLSTRLNANPFLITAGASFGAYHALTFALRHPGLVSRAIGLSGLYDIKQQTNGYSDELVYLHNPCDFIQHEHEPGRLALLRRLDIILAVGRDDGLCANNVYFSGVLWSKQIGNALRIWDGWAHDWPWWRRMIEQYIGGHD
jgi:esterase/lipase superfamily enzyme